MPSARPRGTIVTLWSGSRPGTLRLTRAWPASWYAVSRRSSSERTMLLRSSPSITLSLASSRSFMSTAPLLRRAARRAASLTMFDRSAPDGVDLVDEDDAGRVGLALLEQVAHPRGPDPHEHLHEVRSRHREERPPRLARHGLREEGLAGPGRPDEQGTLGKPAPQPLELLRIFEEVDDLLELLLRLVAPRHVGEGDLRRVAREQLRLGCSEGERPVSTLLHLPQHEDDEAEDEQVRQEAEEEYAERLLLLTRPHVDALLLERLYPLGAGLERQQRREMLRRAPPDRDGVLEVAFDLLPLGNFDRGDVTAVELLGKLGVGDLHRLLAAARRELHQRDGAHDQQRPERQRAERAGPVELARRRNAIRHLGEARDVGQVPEVLGVIEPVADEERARCVESDELWLQHEVRSEMLVQQRANLQTLRVPLPQQRHQSVQRLSRIDDVLDQQNMLTPELRLRIVQHPPVTARDRGGAVARGDQEIHLQRAVETPHQIAQKDEAPLEQPEHDQLALRVGRRDLAAQLPHPPRDGLLIEDDAGELTPARLLETRRTR